MKEETMSNPSSGRKMCLLRSIWVTFSFAVVLFVALAACAPAAPPTPTPLPKPTVAPEPPKAMATAPPAKTEAPAKPPAATATAAPAAAPAKSASIKVGVLGLHADAGAYIAQERGYFKDEGIDVELITFRSGGEMVAPLATGQIHVGGGAASASLFNAIKREIPIKVVADRGYIPESWGGGSVIAARKDLVESGQLKGFEDLKGKTIAINIKGASAEYAVAKMLEKGKLTFAEIKMVEMPFPDMLVALGNKSIDVAVQNEPFITIGKRRGVLASWKSRNEVVPNHQIAMWLYSPEFIKNQPDLAKRFMVAILRGTRDNNDAFFKNKNKAQIVSILMKYTEMKDASMWDEMEPPALNPDGSVFLKDLIDQQAWYFKQGYTKEELEPAVFFDNQYADYAVQKLGKYQ